MYQGTAPGVSIFCQSRLAVTGCVSDPVSTAKFLPTEAISYGETGNSKTGTIKHTIGAKYMNRKRRRRHAFSTAFTVSRSVRRGGLPPAPVPPYPSRSALRARPEFSRRQARYRHRSIWRCTPDRLSDRYPAPNASRPYRPESGRPGLPARQRPTRPPCRPRTLRRRSPCAASRMPATRSHRR